MRAELAAIRSQSSKPFNVNFFCHTTPEPDAAREAKWKAALAPYYRELGIDPCPEAATSAVHRAALKSAAARHTELTNVFTGRPARGIVNRLMREQGPMNHEAPPFPLAAAAVAPLRAKAESQGSGDFSPLWSGTNPSGCKEIPAATLTRELAANL